MAQRILSISGLRGIIGDGLDPAYIVEFAAAVGMICKGGTVVVSRDGRATGTMLKQAVIAGLNATGCNVLDAGIATTPTCGVLVTHHRAQGGIQITASHNPVEWNGLKPFTAEGSVYDAGTGQTLLKILNEKSFAWKPHSSLGTTSILEDPHQPHIDRVLKLVDVDLIRKQNFKVVLDCTHGSGGIITPVLLQKLGCETTVIGGTPDGQFEHTPEPTKENLTSLTSEITRHNADVGFAQDPDADRLAVIDEKGTYIGEELTLALCVEHVLQREKGSIVVNGSTSRVNADLAQKHGVDFYRSHVGEANVTKKMKDVGALLGGEGNGGVIEPRVGYVRDSLVSIAYILEGLALQNSNQSNNQQNITLSNWVNTLPKYAITKDKVSFPTEKLGLAISALQDKFQDATPTTGDGLRMDWNDRWLQIRASNTEPIVRVISEAPDVNTSRKLCDDGIAVLKSIMP